MSIDPSISLGFNPPVQANIPDSINMASNMASNAMKPYLMQQEINASKAQQANTEAQNPGLVADSATKVRALTAQKWFGANAIKWQIDNGKAGLPGENTANGPTGIDYPKMMADASSVGYADMVPLLAKQWSDGAQANIKTATDQQALNDAVQKSGVQAGGVLGTLIDSVPDNLKAGVTKEGIAHLASIYGANSPIVKGITQNFANPNNPSTAEIQHYMIGAKKANISPTDQVNQAQVATQLLIAQQNANTSALSQSQGAASLLPKAIELNGMAAILNAGAQAGQALGQDQTFQSNKTNELKGKYLVSNPSYAPYLQAVSRYNLLNGTQLNPTDPGTVEVLRNEGTKLTAQANGWHAAGMAGMNKQQQQNTVNAPNSNSLPGSQVPPMQTGGKVRIQMPGGQTGTIDASELQQALQQGARQIQ